MPFLSWTPSVFTSGISVTGGIAADALTLTTAAAGNQVIGASVTGDTFNRLRVNGSGAYLTGPGNAALDCTMNRVGVGIYGATGTTSLDVATAGQGHQTKEGSNAKQGTATLTAGSVVVANTSVTANSRIFLTAQSVGGTAGALAVTARTAGTSFTVTSSSGTDTSTFAYEIFEPG